MNNQITGAILAGGGSRRMFPGAMAGHDKALLDLAGMPMLARVIASLRPQVGRLVLSANGDHSRFDPFRLEVVSDVGHALTSGAGLGPLGGLLAAMVWARATREESAALVSVSADVPFLPSDLVQRLSETLPADIERPVVAVSQGQRHPTIALWPMALADDLAATLARGEFGAGRFAERHGAIEVDFPMRKIGRHEIDPFFNANTPDEFAFAQSVLEANTT